ncbi:hypothetical protein ACH5RR_029986 [Cinchona calisaya]|uniref:3'-5' exonuclease domain-containing protein n=1 Tax=Cinchona calisaya TaxID=153742 RepID=A0ABD2YWU5_9GENT
MDTEMEIKFERDSTNQNISTITIDDKINPIINIQTTLVDSESRKDDDLIIKQWLRKIKNNCEADACTIIGLSADCSLHYKNGSNSFLHPPKKEDHPIEVLQLFVGNQCLIYEPRWYDAKKNVPKILKDLLSDFRYDVVGVGMEEVAKKLESQLGLKISRPRDLRTMAGFMDRKYSLEKLAKRVLGGDWKKPDSINWWKNADRSGLSDDKIKGLVAQRVFGYVNGGIRPPKDETKEYNEWLYVDIMVKEAWDEIHSLCLRTTYIDEYDKTENEDLVMSPLSCLRSEFSELRYTILRSKEMPLYDKVIGMVEKEISTRKLCDTPKAERVALVEKNDSIAHANTSTQVGNNNQEKRHHQSALNVAKLVILRNSVEIVNIVASKSIQKKNVGNYTLTSSLRISQANQLFKKLSM